MTECGYDVSVDTATMLVQCFSDVGSNAGKMFAIMRLRCFNVDTVKIVRPYPGKVFANLVPSYS
jgi:hypothetical protein